MSMNLPIEAPRRRPSPTAHRRTERAWVDQADPDRLGLRGRCRKMTFLEFTRYRRWYTTVRRSEILLRIKRREPGYVFRFDADEWYPNWPRHLV